MPAPQSRDESPRSQAAQHAATHASTADQSDTTPTKNAEQPNSTPSGKATRATPELTNTTLRGKPTHPGPTQPPLNPTATTTLNLGLSPTTLKAVLFSIPTLLILLLLVTLYRPGVTGVDAGDPAKANKMADEVKVATQDLTELKQSIDNLKKLIEAKQFDVSPDLREKMTDTSKKLNAFEERLKSLETMLTDTKTASTAAKTAAEGAKTAATNAETKANGAFGSAGTAKDAAEQARVAAVQAKGAAEQAKGAAEQAKGAAEQAKGSADGAKQAASDANTKLDKLATKEAITAEFERIAGILRGNLEEGIGKKQSDLGVRFQKIETLASQLVEWKKQKGAITDVSVIISHGAKIDARPLLPVVKAALDDNPARNLFEGFRLSVVVEKGGTTVGKPILAWPTKEDQVPAYVLKPEPPLPDIAGQESQPKALEPGPLFPAPAENTKPTRRCVFLTHPEYPPPSPDDKRWQEPKVGVDAVLIIPSGSAEKLRKEIDIWAAFCQTRGGAAVVVTVPQDAAKWSNADSKPITDLVRRLTTPY